MKLYSYVIPRDYGFAPNPYFRYCTLATCKPVIRRCAQVGDWVAAFGAAGTIVHEKLVVLMRVEETLTFDQYWDDSRFISKRPVFSKGVIHMYGDNIYHHDGMNWVQELSHHSMADGSTNYINLNRDTGTDRVLVATEFFYFGNNAISIPKKFDSLIAHGIGHRVSRDTDVINNFISYMQDNYKKGVQGTPYSRKTGQFAHYKGE
ncbi:MAG: hypothetical protein PUB52_10140 [Lachnospiraceae bacterium]|nr:hypothetical protein [Lachnospiraceae bacterium]